MKKLIVCTLLTFLAYTGWTQTGVDKQIVEQPGAMSLSNDPVFNRVLTRLVTYPPMAVRSATFGKIYVSFEIDANGRVRNIAALSPGYTGVGFETEVGIALKRMPALNPQFKGRYVLPASFVFLNCGESTIPHVPTNVLPESMLDGRVLLSEVVFRGSSRDTSVYAPPSHEIRY